jgi:hypothetical protein
MTKQEAAAIRKRREALGIGRKKAAEAAGISLYRAFRIEVKAEPAEDADLTTYLDTLEKLEAQAKGKATAAKRPASAKKATPKNATTAKPAAKKAQPKPPAETRPIRRPAERIAQAAAES